MCDTSRHLIKYWDGQSLKVFQGNCKGWDCVDCSAVKKRKLRRQILAGEPNKFATFTLRPLAGEYPVEMRKRLSACFNIFIRRTKRHFNLKSLPFLAVVEAHESGFPHIHVFLRCDFIPQKWIKRAWQEITGAFKVDIRQIRNQNGAARYATKYVTKAPARYLKMPRYWSSRDWRVSPKELHNEQRATAQARLLKDFAIIRYAQLLIDEGWQITKRTSHTIEARHSDNARAPPLWECTRDVSEIQHRRNRTPDNSSERSERLAA